MHFAKIVDGLVVEVLVAEQDFINTQEGQWVQTSYNTYQGIHYDQDRKADGGIALRGNYATIGHTYDSVRDAFIDQKPYPSWLINESTYLHEAPVPYPDDGLNYYWNEPNLKWIKAPDALVEGSQNGEGSLLNNED